MLWRSIYYTYRSSFTYQVIRLQLAGDPSADCFIMALQRITTRRGNARHIWSDNGHKSVEANCELKML